MKEYVKPEMEYMNFATEYVADFGDSISGEDDGDD